MATMEAQYDNQWPIMHQQIVQLDAESKQLFDRVCECVGYPEVWPPGRLREMLSTHLHYKERFTLAIFVLGNSCPPDFLAEWLLKRGSLRDKPACLHLANIFDQHQMGLLARYTCYVLPWRATYDGPRSTDPNRKWESVGLVPRAYIFPVECPDDAFMKVEGWRWTQTIDLLKGNASGLKSNAIRGKANMANRIFNNIDHAPEITIVPMDDPDELPRGYARDMYVEEDGAVFVIPECDQMTSERGAAIITEI